MNPVHIHLLTNHLPILGTLFGLLLLALGLPARNPAFRSAAFVLFLAAAVATPVAYFSGEGSEETVERLAGISKEALEEHEDSAAFSAVAMAVLGALSLAGLILGRIRPAWKGRMTLIIGAAALLAFATAARTGYLGGGIRHTELSPQGSQGQGPADAELSD